MFPTCRPAFQDLNVCGRAYPGLKPRAVQILPLRGGSAGGRTRRALPTLLAVTTIGPAEIVPEETLILPRPDAERGYNTIFRGLRLTVRMPPAADLVSGKLKRLDPEDLADVTFLSQAFPVNRGGPRRILRPVTTRESTRRPSIAPSTLYAMVNESLLRHHRQEGAVGNLRATSRVRAAPMKVALSAL